MNWKQELRESITDIERLSERLPIDRERQKALADIIDMYPMRIPDYYLSLIDPDNPDDPIARMCVPSSLVFSPSPLVSKAPSSPEIGRASCRERV